MPRLQIRTLFEGKTNTIIETLDARLGEVICHTLGKSKQLVIILLDNLRRSFASKYFDFDYRRVASLRALTNLSLYPQELT